MSTVTELITNKLIDIIDNPVIQKQHRLYPHLVPAERTVHRTKPRRLVFPAIRWVNPQRYYPLMDASQEDMNDWNAGQCDRGITELNEYRRMGTHILNKYNQQVSLIEQGKTPYAILFPEKKWMSLADRMERAQRLRQGSRDWNKMIDRKAIQMRQTCGQKQRSNGNQWRMDDVDALWERSGVETRPYFKDPKKGSDDDGYKKDLRSSRLTGEGGKYQSIEEAFLDSAGLRSVAPEEMRDGEVQELPGGAQQTITPQEAREQERLEAEGRELELTVRV